MRSRLLLLATLALMVPVFASADNVPKDFKQQLESRYKGKKVMVVVPRIIVGLYRVGGLWPTDSDFNVHYDHFSPGVQISGKYEKRNNLADRTTEQVTGGADFIDELATGEALQVIRVAMFKRGDNVYMVDLLLRALAGKRLATRLETSPAGYVHHEKQSYGVHFRFIFPFTLAQRGDYDAVVHEINPYLLPEDEYRGARIAAAQKAEAAKNVELRPGMSKDEVFEILGEPQKTVVFGSKTILKYPEITLELEDDKVVTVKTN